MPVLIMWLALIYANFFMFTHLDCEPLVQYHGFAIWAATAIVVLALAIRK